MPTARAVALQPLPPPMGRTAGQGQRLLFARLMFAKQADNRLPSLSIPSTLLTHVEQNCRPWGKRVEGVGRRGSALTCHAHLPPAAEQQGSGATGQRCSWGGGTNAQHHTLLSQREKLLGSRGMKKTWPPTPWGHSWENKLAISIARLPAAPLGWV